MTDSFKSLELINRVTDIAVGIISRFEGLEKLITVEGEQKVQSYWDPWGRVWTIGRGLTGPGITKGTVWSLSEEDERFRRRVAFTVERTLGMIHVGLTDEQYAALVSFAFNVGLDEDTDDIPEGLGDSTLLKLVNAGQFDRAGLEFLKWDKAWDPETKTRRPLNGLTRRRRVERDYFLYGKTFEESSRD